MNKRTLPEDADESWCRMTLAAAGSGMRFTTPGLASFLHEQSAGSRMGRTTTAEMSKLVAKRLAHNDADQSPASGLNEITAAWCGLTSTKTDGTPQFVSPEAMERILGDSELVIFDDQGRRSKAFLVIDKAAV